MTVIREEIKPKNLSMSKKGTAEWRETDGRT